VAYYVTASIHWQIEWDTGIMHYVVFLMRHGFSPYRYIIDCNLPAAYFMDSWAMHVFGVGDLGWRLYDFTLLAVMTVSMVVIALPYEWTGGLLAGVVFLLLHGAQVPTQAVQREQVMSTLILAGYAFLFTGLRSRRPILFLPFGLLLGLASSVKPTTVPLGVLLLIMAYFPLRKQNISITPYLAFGLVGAAVAILFNVQFFIQYHDWADFLVTSNHLIRYYAGIGNSRLPELLHSLLPLKYLFLIATGAVLAYGNRATHPWENWERGALILGVLFGALSFIAQRKDFPYHLYVFIAFLYLWSAIEFGKAFRTRTIRHVCGLACLTVGLLVQVALSDMHMAHVETNAMETSALAGDLSRLGGSTLARQVQCFDMVDVCFTVLNRMELIPYSTFVGDYMFFAPRGEQSSVYYRNMMWNDLQERKPKVIVVTNAWFGEENSFDKLDQWPQLADELAKAYKLTVTRSFGSRAYRIYTLIGAQLPQLKLRGSP